MLFSVTMQSRSHYRGPTEIPNNLSRMLAIDDR
jgi:hypothetical protein